MNIKRLVLCSLLFPFLSGCAENSDLSSNSDNESASEGEEVKEVELGSVYFGSIYVYGTTGYKTVEVRPIFTVPEREALENFVYETEDTDKISINGAAITYVSNGIATVTATSENFSASFLVYCQTTYEHSSSINALRSHFSSVGATNESTLFIGASFFEFWKNGNAGTYFYETFADYDVFNVGISTTQTHDWRPVINNFLPTLIESPKNIVVNIGLNNINDNNETGVTAGINVVSMLEDLHFFYPDAEIYYFSITRCVGTLASNWSKHSDANTFTSAYISTRDYLHYLDVMEVYGSNYADYLMDELHPNAAGYQVFTDLILENVDLDLKE